MFKGISFVNTTQQKSEKFKRDCVNARSLHLPPQCLPICSKRRLNADHSPKFFIRRLCTGAICSEAFIDVASRRPGVKVLFKLLWEHVCFLSLVFRNKKT